MIRFPPLSDRPFARETPLKTVTFAEDRLRKAYQRSVPGAALEVKHSTAAPSPSQRFVAAQVELMDKEGLSEEEAFVAARVQLSKETRAKNVMRAIAREQALADGIPMGKNLLERVQESEIKYLAVGNNLRATVAAEAESMKDPSLLRGAIYRDRVLSTLSQAEAEWSMAEARAAKKKEAAEEGED